MAAPDTDPPAPKAFISYSWDDPAHKEWVKRLATRLRADGVDVTLDRWHAAPGDQIPVFMERAVRENDFVIAVCTPRFKEKSDGRGGGVGYEGDIMTAYVFAGGAERKFIPVLRRGNWGEAAPTWLLGRARIDLSGDPYSALEYEELLRTLHGAREEAPPIGGRPNFGSDRGSQVVPGPELVTPSAGPSIPQRQSSVTPVMAKVMYVEDEKYLADIVRRWLEEAGYEVVLAKNERIALAFAASERPDLILLDLSLSSKAPELREGWELNRRLKENPQTREIPVVIVSGNALDSLVRDVELCRKEGIAACIIKPFLHDELINHVRTYIRKASPSDEL
jgi:CheY-like chemotaxis protein